MRQKTKGTAGALPAPERWTERKLFNLTDGPGFLAVEQEYGESFDEWSARLLERRFFGDSPTEALAGLRRMLGEACAAIDALLAEASNGRR